MTFFLATILLAANPVTVPVDEPVALLVFGRLEGPNAETCQRQYAEVVSFYQAGYPVYYANIDEAAGKPWIKPLGITMVPWHILVIDGKAAEFSPGYKSAWYMSEWIMRARERAVTTRAEKQPVPKSTPPVNSTASAGVRKVGREAGSAKVRGVLRPGPSFSPGRTSPDQAPAGLLTPPPSAEGAEAPSRAVPATLPSGGLQDPASAAGHPATSIESSLAGGDAGQSKKNDRPQRWVRFGGG